MDFRKIKKIMIDDWVAYGVSSLKKKWKVHIDNPDEHLLDHLGPYGIDDIIMSEIFREFERLKRLKKKGLTDNATIAKDCRQILINHINNYCQDIIFDDEGNMIKDIIKKGNDNNVDISNLEREGSEATTSQAPEQINEPSEKTEDVGSSSEHQGEKLMNFQERITKLEKDNNKLFSQNQILTDTIYNHNIEIDNLKKDIVELNLIVKTFINRQERYESKVTNFIITTVRSLRKELITPTGDINESNK